MEYICRICNQPKPESAFTEKSHSLHTCKKCNILSNLRTEERNQLDEIFKIFIQTRISHKDTVRLKDLGNSKYPKVALTATLIFEVAQLRPYKKGRHAFLEQKYPELAKKIEEAGLAYPQYIKANSD
ncbi:MAG: hypothetical protein CVV41_11885 [Candidatus Riflebacteria bacterium HGW-Riflebacteria-1]|jgi:hypothetical protein|nr:MAG: hypothetical protein CVV41_11885 [Candidatus Riflebacteria bacterium HGW-Riflebacteria-1]